MQIDEVVKVLDALAPPELAAGWDNVGLLVRGERPVRRLALCIDLTEAVLDEALALEADMVVAYHPPLFKGVKRLVGRTPTERIVARVLREGLSVHSPHTALDAVRGGLNDWLLEAFGPVEHSRPIDPSPTRPDEGAGRLARMAQPCSLGEAVQRIKAHLGLKQVRVATPGGDLTRAVRSLAVCPGAGGSLFSELGPVDLLLTGEMRHHDVLARVGSGSTVVLTDHTHSERGYLQRFATRLGAALPELTVQRLLVDDDPLVIL